MDRHSAIRNTHSTVVIINGELDATDKDGNVVILDESLITAEMERLQIEFTALAYSRSRASAYDSVGNQLDQIMKDMKNGTTTHQTACEAVKSQFPKPS